MKASLPVLLGLGLASPSFAQGGGIETLSGEMLFSGGTRVSLSHLHRERGGLLAGSSSVADPSNRSAVEDRTTLSFDHGVSSRFTLTALLPMVRKTSESAGVELSGSGIGDVAVLAKFLLAHRYWERSAWHVAMATGVELPTGETGVHDGGVLLAPGMQPGSGSWDPFVSVSANLELDRWRFDVTTLFKHNSSGARQYQAGDNFTFDLVGAYRFLHAQYPGPSANVKLGLLFRDQGSAQLAGATVVDSGSEVWLGRVALSWHPQPQWDLGISVDLPLSQSYGGTQLGLDYQVSLAVGIRF
jgi:hypothetical protein